MDLPRRGHEGWDGYLGGQVTDYGTWADRAQRAAFFGMDYSSNIDLGTIPPQIVPDPGPHTGSDAEMLFLELAAPHFRADGSIVFTGQARIVIRTPSSERSTRSTTRPR